MKSRLDKLTSYDVKAEVDSGQHVSHVTSAHALLRASGYLKYVLAKEEPCSVLFRGEAKLHPSLPPRLYRGVKSQKMKERKDASLAKYLSLLRSENKVLRSVAMPVHEPLLQHYGIRTQWLDLVDNVWVALWFACHQAHVTGRRDEYLHFEQRIPRSPADYAYVLLVRSDATDPSSGQPGVWKGKHTELVDLRVAAPSTFLRPHAQHALALRRCKGLDHLHMDYSEFVVGRIRVLLVDALRWLGSGALLTTHALFPPAQYDFGYRELLMGAAEGNDDVGAIHHVGA